MVATLESIVEKFGEEMAPYAVGLMQHLAIAFWRIVDADDKVSGRVQEAPPRPVMSMACFCMLSRLSDDGIVSRNLRRCTISC